MFDFLENLNIYQYIQQNKIDAINLERKTNFAQNSKVKLHNNVF
jgi:hypothetical protein